MSEIRKCAGGWRSGRCSPGQIQPPRYVAASDAQRAKVAGRQCLVCGRGPVDPAHLVPQRLGGCASADCVVPLCRTHHRLYDSARLWLGQYLAVGFEAELGHALEHVSPVELARGLSGLGWPAPWETNSDSGGG